MSKWSSKIIERHTLKAQDGELRCRAEIVVTSFEDEDRIEGGVYKDGRIIPHHGTWYRPEVPPEDLDGWISWCEAKIKQVMEEADAGERSVWRPRRRQEDGEERPDGPCSGDAERAGGLGGNPGEGREGQQGEGG